MKRKGHPVLQCPNSHPVSHESIAVYCLPVSRNRSRKVLIVFYNHPTRLMAGRSAIACRRRGHGNRSSRAGAREDGSRVFSRVVDGRACRSDDVDGRALVKESVAGQPGTMFGW